MTICLAFHFGQYVLLAADTRTRYGAPVLFVDDESTKVFATEIGLVTGAGLSQLLDAVRKHLNSSEIQTVTDIRTVVAEELAAARRRRWDRAYTPEVVESWLTHTGWFLTWTTVINDEPTLRLGVLHGTLMDDLPTPDTVHVVEPVGASLIAPWEAGLEEAQTYQEWLTEMTRPISAFDTVDEHFAYHRRLCAHVISDASDRYESVSSAMHVGVHTISGQQEVTDRIDIDLDV